MSTAAMAWMVVALVVPGQGRFVDHTDAIGLGPEVVGTAIARTCLADLDGDGFPDAVVDRHKVFLNRPDPTSPLGRRFERVPGGDCGLPTPDPSTVTVFADLNNDGHPDAVVSEYIDRLNPDWKDHGRRSGWHAGRGDGTFGPRRRFIVQPRTTISIAAADVNGDGWLDLLLGNSYRRYGHGYEGYANDLLLSDGVGGWQRTALPDDSIAFDEQADIGGRPTFGVLIFDPDVDPRPILLEMSYGRRWNRAWRRSREGRWRDLAPDLGLDGDGVRHGRYPPWMAERARTDPRFRRADEKPFRANGNTFDAAVGDVDNDGDLDLFLSEITHGWAGDSSDRSRLLLNRLERGAGTRFEHEPLWQVDRIPDDHDWNQGDLFCALADLDHDGRLDLVLSSGDYPDDQRLRVYLQGADRAVHDATSELGIDHDGSQQISLGDVDGDGDLDVLAGQRFFRYPSELKAGRTPRLRLLANQSTDERRSVVIRLYGDGQDVNRDALGTIVEATLPDGTRLTRQLIGVGGHAGKQMDFAVHLGLGAAETAQTLMIRWPNRTRTRQDLGPVPAGRYRLVYGGGLERVGP